MRLRSLIRCNAVLTAIIVAVPSVDVHAQSRGKSKPDAAYRGALAQYKQWVNRDSLRKRTDGRLTFASTQDLRALDVLVKSYSKPEVPRDHNKYLIASIATNAFGKTAPDEKLAAWRRKHRKPIDAWLWYETLDLQRMESRRDELLEIADGKENAYIRGAALAAMIERLDSHDRDVALAAWCMGQLEALPSKEIDRAIRLEAIASIVLKKKRHVRKDPWKEICRAVITKTFEEKETPRRSHVCVARYLTETFGTQNLGFVAKYWFSELDRPPTVKRRKSGATSSTGFAGIRTKGDNIVYVIDASDSMCKPISNLKKKDKGPTTGSKKEKKPKDGRVPTADDLDWGRISTRFDAAREFLRTALATLDPKEHHFSVILFGDEAIPLNATPTLVAATPGNIKRALSELNAIEIQSPTNDRPDGRIRGATNFHGGVRLAFRMTHNGLTKKAEYTDTKAMIQGCDTLFIMSDGAPSMDDWYALDDADPEDRAGDIESGVPHEKTPRLWNPGPYATINHGFIRDDVRRLNLLRRCEIHCVAIGEALQHFLDAVAKIGHGRSIRIDSRVTKRGEGAK